MYPRVKAVLNVDGAFMSETSELPDISPQNRPKVYQKSHQSEFLNGKMTSGNYEALFLFGIWSK